MGAAFSIGSSFPDDVATIEFDDATVCCGDMMSLTNSDLRCRLKSSPGPLMEHGEIGAISLSRHDDVGKSLE